MRSVEHAPAAIEMLTHQHATFRQCATPGSALNLQRAVLDVHRVVLIDHAFVLQRKDALQILPRRGQEGTPWLSRRNSKLAVQFGDVTLSQKTVGFLHGSDPPQPQLLRQTSLPGAEVALAASARLR